MASKQSTININVTYSFFFFDVFLDIPTDFVYNYIKDFYFMDVIY